MSGQALMLGWMVPGCDMDNDVAGYAGCDIFPQKMAPMELMGTGFFEIGFSAVNGIYFSMGGFLKLTGAKDVVWANPFGLAPSLAGGLLRTSTRQTLIRLTKAALLYEQSP
jgi:hypothetical protein